MPSSIPTRVRLTAPDKAALAEYWRFFEPISAEINAELRASLLALPEWAALLRGMSADQIAEQDRLGRQRQHRALVDGDWAPYLDDLRQQGVQYARSGVSFVAWYDVIAIYRELMRRRLTDLSRTDLERAQRIGDGLSRFIDIAMAHLGEAYLDAKEQIITRQQAAIRELSVPVLVVRDRVLILPLVGMIDADRARQLIETMLSAIRDQRARGVVIDVTGVPLVDTAVANHLVQATDAARLMGSCVVISGVSSEMAQTLVALGANLPAAHTVGDLQEGIREIERELGFL